MKNIPIPPRNIFMIRLIDKVESVIKRMRWKAFFFLNPEDANHDSKNDDTLHNPADGKFGFRSRKCPPQIQELKPFEDDMLKMIENIRFRKVTDQFQSKLKADITKIRSSDKMLIPADKTRNLYEVDRHLYKKLLRENLPNDEQSER